MTLDALKQTLADALGSGKIGTPVSLRIHLQLSDAAADLASALAAVMLLAESVFGGPASATLTARRDASHRQLTVLVCLAGGQTVFVTLGRGVVPHPLLHLLLIGNHGTVRLEGAELFDGHVAAPADLTQLWHSRIAQCLDRDEAISISTA